MSYEAKRISCRTQWSSCGLESFDMINVRESATKLIRQPSQTRPDARPITAILVYAS